MRPISAEKSHDLADRGIATYCSPPSTALNRGSVCRFMIARRATSMLVSSRWWRSVDSPSPVPLVLSDTTAAVLDVPQRYVDTALTLGASRWQIITKVLGPLAAPSIFNSLRLLFGLAFGYVMLAELVKFGSATGGLGDLINMSQRRGEREPIILVLVIIPMVAWAIDRALWWLQSDLFPYRYGGAGLIPRFCGWLLHGRRTEFRP